jgi:tetratricopeptide (TPR) repeat protein
MLRQTVLLLALALSPGQSGDIEQYRALVDNYRDARLAPVHELAGWSTSRVQAAAEHCAEDSRLACAMLHTDVAIYLLVAGKAADASQHLNAAERLLDAARARTPAHWRFAERWYLMMVGYLHTLDAPVFADDMRARMKKREFGLPDAKAAFERGFRAETFGALVASTSHAGRIGGLAPAAAGPFEGAAREYEKAVKLDSSFLEASLRLGRLRVVLRQSDRAIEPLERASRSSERHVAYLALLYQGAVAERQDQFAAAEEYYREANAVYRWGMSGPVALAQLLSRTGREAQAREILTAHLGRTAGRIVDPLWTYPLKPGDYPRPTLDALRSEVWR